jgi:hypothetical protein
MVVAPNQALAFFSLLPITIQTTPTNKMMALPHTYP